MNLKKKDSMILVRQVLWNLSSKEPRARELLRILNIEESYVPSFDTEDTEYICSALVEELTATGLDGDSEPTQRGLQIEAAIDWVRAHQKTTEGP